MTHTPGPWIWKAERNYLMELKPSVIWAGREGTLEIDEANARLIAYAPDLLEALKEAKNGLRYWEPQTAYGASERARICALVDAAITKATGVDQ